MESPVYPPHVPAEAIEASNCNNPLLPLIRKLESKISLSDEERAAINNLPVKLRQLLPGHDIGREGEKTSQCCFILEGWACRYKRVGEGKRQILSLHIAGDLPDLHSLHIPQMDYNLATITAATVAFIPHRALHDLTLRFPRVAAALWRDTLTDAAIFRQWMTNMGRRDAFDHTAHLFCEVYLRQEAVGLASDLRCPWPLTQRDLADATGLSNVHVNRVVQEMRSSGMITIKRSTLVIHAWVELAQAVEFDATYLHL